MRRVAAIVVLAVAVAAFAGLAGGAGSSTGSSEKYWVIFDNAFGLIKGGDLKIAGVRNGKITNLELQRSTARARIGFEVAKDDFGGLRKDVRCEIRPQSLIGEYFVDCLPGTDPTVLPPGSTIPVEQTASTVPPDLVVDILRRPYAQRLSIIVSQLGAGVAGGGEGLNAALRRASPALRETEKVLRTLGDQNQVLSALARDSDQVVGALADNRADVARFVVTADKTATASAERKRELAQSLARLPALLEALRPAMAALGDTADGLTPTLSNLDASAGRLKTFFDRLGPFAESGRPAIAALGKASVTGDAAVKIARPTVSELRRFAKGTPELGKNLSIILRHLDNRDFAAEADPRSPGGKGYTGLEALLQYIYDQTLSINIFNGDTHMLKVTPILGRCADYADIQRLKETPGLVQECGAALGPNQPGVNFPDPTATGAPSTRSHKHRAPGADGASPTPPAAPAPAGGTAPKVPHAPSIPKVLPGLGDLLSKPVTVPQLHLPKIGKGDGLLGLSKQPGRATNGQRDAGRSLLDYLLGP